MVQVCEPIGASEAQVQTGASVAAPAVCAVIVHYRCATALAACLDSLAAHAPGVAAIVVENGSGDASASAAVATAERAGAHMVVAPTNRGFGAGCNLGIDVALARWPELQHVLLLNPDTAIEPGCVEALCATAQRHPDAGVVGGRVMSLDGRQVLFENGRLRPWTLSRSHVAAPAAAEFTTTFVTGALMLLAADLLRGLRFDERYFLYAEDLDLCCAVRARGRTLWIHKAAVVRHAEGGSQRDEQPIVADLRPTQLRHMTRSKVYFARKRLPPLQRAVFFAVALLVKPLLGMFVARSWRFLPIYLGGLREGWRVPLAPQLGQRRNE
jgi:N-acetylglucosaminyl-diphospho-decaprenol L-rhamnosyltransferase